MKFIKLFAAIIATTSLLQPAMAQPQADSLLNFIKNNKTRSSIFLQLNDSTIAAVNENKLMPLASTVKIMVAIEFAKQAGNNIINQNTLVPLKDLDAYYLPNTDGGAHPAWLAAENIAGHLTNDSISLINVARGMMMYSSNANTEYLMDLLGLDNVKNNIQLLGLNQHTAIYPLVASLFLYQNPKQMNEEKLLKSLKKMDDQTYSRYIYDIHKALKYNSTVKEKFRPQDLSVNMQQVWSSRLPASTAKDYVRVVKVLNNRKFFSPESYAILAKEMEYIMENPANKTWLKHSGMKGGNTPWVLTKALYATTQKDERIEMAYFFNGLTGPENEMLKRWTNSFEYAVLSNGAFREKLRTALK